MHRVGRRGAGDSPQWAAIAVAVLVVVALLVLAVLFARSITARLASARLIDRATTIAKSADVDVVAVDKAVRAPIDEHSRETKALAAKRIGPARVKLEAGRRPDASGHTSPSTTTSASRRFCCERRPIARLEMLKLAEPILTTRRPGRLCGRRPLVRVGPPRRGQGAEPRRRRAVQQAHEAFGRAVEPAARAGPLPARLGERRLRSRPARPFPHWTCVRTSTYVATLKQLNSLARQSNTAWLKGKTADANVITTRYNILEKQALEQAAKVPASPNKAITEAYNGRRAATWRPTSSRGRRRPKPTRGFESTSGSEALEGQSAEGRSETVSANQFWSGWWWPALTAALGFIYTWLLLRQ